MADIYQERIQKLIDKVEKYKAFDQNEVNDCVVGIGLRLVAKSRKLVHSSYESLELAGDWMEAFANYFGITWNQSVLIFWATEGTKEQMIERLKEFL